MATQKFDKKAYKRMLEELSIKQQGVREGIEAGKQLQISRGGGGGNVPGEDGPYRTPPPSETPPYPPKELANFLAPGGSGKTLSEEAYWDGLQTIMETTEAGSDEQNKRLNILWHQFQDQVNKPQDGLKIAKTPSQQNATNMRELIKKLTKEGKHVEAQALYREQFPRA